jgi:hypothetical protein
MKSRPTQNRYQISISSVFLLIIIIAISSCSSDDANKVNDGGTTQLKEQQKQKIIEEMQSSENQFDVLIKYYGGKDTWYALGYSLGKKGSDEAYRSLIKGMEFGKVMGTTDGRFKDELTSGYEDGSNGKSTSEKTGEIIELIEISDE